MASPARKPLCFQGFRAGGRAELPDRARQLVTYYLERRLPDVPIACPADCGLAGTGPHEGLRLDVYAELGLATVYGVAQSIPANEFLHGEDVDIVRLYLAWNHPDRYPTDFTLSAYRQFEAYVRPLLDGAGRSTLPAALAEEDLRRAAAALHPHAFDPPLAVRSLLTALAATAPAAETLLPILTGR